MEPVKNTTETTPLHTSTQNQNNGILNKVRSVVIEIFEFLKNLVLFPFRYIGGKDFSIPGVILRFPFAVITNQPLKSLFGSGYHQKIEKELSSKESLQFAKYAAVSGSQDSCDQSWIKPMGLELYDIKNGNFDLKSIPKGIELDHDCFYDFSTGLKCTISVQGDEVIVAFGARQSLSHLQWRNPNINDDERMARAAKISRIQEYAIAKNLLGSVPTVYTQADTLLQVIRSHPEFQGKKIALTGQCLGGSISQYLAIKNQIPTVCFNTLALGAGLQASLGDKLLSRADEFVTHISVATDFVSDNRYLRVFDRALTLLGIRTPGNFGKRYEIPSGYKSYDQVHTYVIGSLMKHLGYQDRDKFDILKKDELDIAKNANPSNFQI